MSMLFGIFYRDAKPVGDELETMYRGLAHCPHEKHRFIKRQNCGFGHMLTYNTPEARHECMPLYDPDKRLVFVAEGRLDNREELFSALGIPLKDQPVMPDGTLIYRSYLRWGEACVDQLCGKWSFAVFDERQQSLFIARDKMDYTALNYYMDDRVLVFSTSIKGLFSLPFIEKEVDEMMLARLLIVWPGDYDKTYYRNLRRILPSHTLKIDRKNSRLERYWSFESIPVQYGRKLEDYTEELYHFLNLAVKARLRSDKPVAATLSGGLDSGTVCWIAAKQLASQGKRLRTFSHVPLFEPARSLPDSVFGDERPYIEATAKSLDNIDTTFLDSSHISPLQGLKKAIQMTEEPFHGACNAYWMVDIYQTAALAGFGSLLLGEFGNATISWAGMPHGLSFEDHLKRYGILRTMKFKVFRPLLYGKNPLGRFYKQVVFGSIPWRNRSFCNDDFERRLNLVKKIKASEFDATFKNHFDDPKEQQRQIMRVNIMRYPYGAQFGCATGLEFRDPTSDTRVIATGLSIPNELFIGPQNKWILRSMMAGKLPDEVLLNPRKGRQSADIGARAFKYGEEIEHVLTQMKESASISSMVDMEKARKLWDKNKSLQPDYDFKFLAAFFRTLSLAGCFEV